MTARKLNPTDKAAVVLLALGEELAAQVMAGMSRAEAVRIGGALARLGRVDKATAEAALTEFRDQLAREQGGLVGDSKVARRLMTAALGSAVGVGEEIVDMASPALSEALERLDPKGLAAYLRREQPQTAAVVLAHLPAKKCGETLKLLPSTQHVELIGRLARLGPVDAETLALITEAVLQEATRSVPGGRQALGGAGKVAALLNTLGRTEGERLMADLEHTDPELAAEVRSQMFRFVDLARLEDRGLQELVRTVPGATLRLALRSAGEELRQLFYRNMSPRAAAALKDDVETMPKVRLGDAEAAQRQVAATARALVEAGRVQLRDPDDVYV